MAKKCNVTWVNWENSRPQVTRWEGEKKTKTKKDEPIGLFEGQFSIYLYLAFSHTRVSLCKLQSASVGSHFWNIKANDRAHRPLLATNDPVCFIRTYFYLLLPNSIGAWSLELAECLARVKSIEKDFQRCNEGSIGRFEVQRGWKRMRAATRATNNKSADRCDCLAFAACIRWIRLI